MNPKERVYRAIWHQKLDFLPSQINFTPEAEDKISKALGIQKSEITAFAGNHIVGCFSLGSVEEYLQDPPTLKEALSLGLAHQKAGDNLVFDDWGVGWDLIPDGGWPAVHPLADLASYPDYVFPDPSNPHLMDHVRRAVLEYGDTYFVTAAHHTVLFERAWALRGFENHLIDFHQNRGLVEDLYDRITDYQINLARNFIAAGVHGAVVGDDYGTQHGLIMKPELWRKVIKPRLRKIWQVYQDAGIPVIHHSCGDIRTILDDFLEMKLDVLHPIQPLAMPIQDVITRCGDKLCYFGGIDTQQLLPFGSLDEIQEATRSAIQSLGQHQRYIIAPAQAIMPDVSIENTLGLLDSIKRYKYPK